MVFKSNTIEEQWKTAWKRPFLKNTGTEHQSKFETEDMLNIKELTKALKQVAEEKGLEPDKVLEVIESSIAAAYKKEYGERGEVVKCKVDQTTGELKFWQVKTVVDETTVRFVTDEEEIEEPIGKDKKGKKEAAKE